jgi:hypothetical protein
MTKHDPLAAHRARVATAERELENARDAMRSRAKILGISRTALFGDCAFVSRESAKEWVKDARAEVHAEARASRRENIAALESPTRNSKANEINQIVRRSKATIPGAIEPQPPGIRQK